MSNPHLKKKQFPPAAVNYVPRGVSDAARRVAETLAAKDRAAVKPWLQPDELAKEGARVGDEQFRAQGGIVSGMVDGPPGTGLAPPSVLQPGGSVLTEAFQHPLFKTTERLFRVLPETGMFEDELSPTRPFSFPLGAFEVPTGMNLWLTDYEFAVLRLSGQDAGDFVYAEQGRFSGQLGFDLTINGVRPNNIAYDLNPSPIPDIRQEFREPQPHRVGRFPAPADAFNEAAANSFGATGGAGTSLLPNRPDVQGPRSGPFTIVVEEDHIVELSGSVFRPIETNIAAFEGRLAGFLIHANLSRTLQRRYHPK